MAAIVTAASNSHLEQELNSVVGHLDSWFRSNGLALNKDKTCFMAFDLNGRLRLPLKVVAGDTELKQKA